MEDETRRIMSAQEAIAKAEQELSTSRYIAECTRSPGMRAIHDKRCSWLSVIVDLAKKAAKVDAVEVASDPTAAGHRNRTHGRWYYRNPTDTLNEHLMCTACECLFWKNIEEMASYPYCPNCGAKMDGDGNG